MRRAALRRSELCAIDLLCRQQFSSVYDLATLSVPRLLLPLEVTFESYGGYSAATGIPRESLFAGTAEGLTVRHGGKYLILYDERGQNLRRRNFTLAHELGHVLLAHAGLDGACEEREANAFAASLLSPAVVWHYLIRECGEEESAARMSAIFPISAEAAARRLRDLARAPVRHLSDSEITLLLHLFGRLGRPAPVA